MFKNVGSQKLILFAFDSGTNLPKTGDAANITAYVGKDYGAATVLGDTSATEIDSTNAKGYYLFDLTQAETNADTLHFTGKSSTSNIVVIGVPAVQYTVPANFTTFSIDSNGRIDIIKVNGTSQAAGDIYSKVAGLTFTVSNQVDVNAKSWAGGTIPAPNVTGVPLTDSKYLLGTIFATPNTAGLLDVNAKQGGGVAWNSGSITSNTLATDCIGSTQWAASATTEVQTGLATSSALASVQADTDDIQTRLPAALVGGRLDCSVGAMASGVLTNAAFAADTGQQTVRSNTAQTGSTSTTLKLDASASATTNFYVPCLVFLTGGTGAGQLAMATAYNGSTKVLTIQPAWRTTPDNTTTFALKPMGPVDCESWVTSGLAAPFVAGIPQVDLATIGGSGAASSAGYLWVDVRKINAIPSAGAGGYVGIDWSAINAPTSTINLSGTTIGVAAALTNLPSIPANWITAGGINAAAITAAKFATDAIDSNAFAASTVTEIQSGLSTLTAAQAASAVWQNATPGDFTVTGSIGKGLFTSGNAPGAASGLALVGSAMALTNSERNSTATALLDLAAGIENGVTLRQSIRAIAAACAGKRSNSGTNTEQFDAIGNPGTARIIPNADAAGDGTPTLSL